MGTSPCTDVYLKTNILPHASKYFVTSLNVGKEFEGVLRKIPTHPPLHCGEEEFEECEDLHVLGVFVILAAKSGSSKGGRGRGE